MRAMRLKTLAWVMALLVALTGAAATWAYQAWLQRPLPVLAFAQDQVLEVTVPERAGASAVAQVLARAGVAVPPRVLSLWFVWSDVAHRLQAGSYEFPAGVTPTQLRRMLVRGEQAMRRVTLPEGWHFAQWRQALAQAANLRPDSATLPASAIMQRLGLGNQSPEGAFFPATYAYPKNSSDWVVWEQAARAMQQVVAKAWGERAPNLPLQTPHEAVVLASLIEKETGRAADRAMISGVFHNRLRLGMRLQTDPSVIYGLGDAFDGDLKRVHLRRDGPYNTYTRRGLPPTAIAMPGLASLQAALNPASTEALYFVARGDGSSQFSRTLREHNQAVRRYQLGQP